MDISQRNGAVRRSRPDDPNNELEQAVWRDNLTAAGKSQGKDLGMFFFMRQLGVGAQKPPARAGFGQGNPIKAYGPFRNVGGGIVPRGDQTFIDIYSR